MAGFGDRVIERMRELGHPLCVGLDPFLERIPKAFHRGAMTPRHPKTAQAIEEFCCRIIDLVASDVAIIKPQVALFERLGVHGWHALRNVIRYARSAGLLVLLDAKRGDIAETAIGYANAYLALDAPCGVDALTVNPYLGPDSLEPFMVAAEQTARGVIVLVRNSNPASSVYQSMQTEAGPYFLVVAGSLATWHTRLANGTTGWSSLGVTVAATHADDTERIRMALPHALFLVLGYGTQGASARDAVWGFHRGPAGLEGGIVSSSRPILFPAAFDADAQTWERGVRNALERAISDLGAAVA